MLRTLRWRIPLFVCALVVIILGTFLAVTHREIERTLIRSTRDRAATVAGQFADVFARSMRTNIEDGRRLGSDPALLALAANATEETRAAALKTLPSRTPGSFRRIEVWNDAGARVLEISTPGKTPSGATVFFPADPPPDRAGVSELRTGGELSYFHVTSEVRDGTAPGSSRLGWLRRYGRVTFTGNLKDLIGAGAMVRVGSASASWTDMFGAAAAPPSSDPRSDIGEYVAADGRRWVGASVPVGETPWLTWVGFPRATVVAPARGFMRRMIVLALVFVALSVGIVALLGIRLARRVGVLTTAAEAIAAGNYERRVPAGRADEIGALSRAFNTMSDRLTQALGALKESHEHTHFALASARIGVWESRAATGEMTCSDSMTQVHGVAASALPRTPDEFLAVVESEDRPGLRQILEGQTENDLFDMRYRVVLPDGSVGWIEGKGQRRRDRSEAASVLGVSIDVTDQRRLEAQLRQAQKMEAVGQLAGGVAHDFNNLLTAILGHGNLLLENLPEHHHLRGDVIEILTAGDRAAALTRQLLAFSRRQVMQPQILDVNAVIGGVEKLLRRLIGEQIEIVTSLAAGLEPVRLDPGQLEQVLVNLAVNARDAMPDGGTLTITTAATDLDQAYANAHPSISPGRHVVMSVSDTGTGMDAETQAHLFEPFFTTKPAGKGTGLGLATVYGIVKQSGGHIYVYSEPGHGSTFKIYFPGVIEKITVVPRKAAPVTIAGGTETILLVEDDAQVRTIAHRILEQLGYRVIVASNGDEALRAATAVADTRLDLVVSDVIMPGMTGPELCQRLVQRYPDVRVLFTSGYSGDAIARHGVLETGTEFIEKPYTPSDFARAVRDALHPAGE